MDVPIVAEFIAAFAKLPKHEQTKFLQELRAHTGWDALKRESDNDTAEMALRPSTATAGSLERGNDVSRSVGSASQNK